MSIDIIFSEGKDGDEVGSFSNGELDETEASFEREIGGARMCGQALSGATHDDDQAITFTAILCQVGCALVFGLEDGDA